MSYDDKSNRSRCDTCGRFMKYDEVGSSWVFVPESYLTHEEDRIQCRKCTEKYGRLFPMQCVRVDLCSGIYKEAEDADKRLDID